jgi:uncharacterized protein (TIGR04255 family)
MANLIGNTARVPVWEVAISASTIGQPLLDPYSVEGVHSRFRDNFPHVERQPPVEVMEVYPALGSPIIQQPPMFLPHNGLVNSRWWFIAPTGDRLVQIQEDFIAFNWRRQALPPLAPYPYIGWSGMRDGFEQTIRTLGLTDELTAQPTVTEVLYDNLIPLLAADGKRLRLADILDHIKFPSDGPQMHNFNAGWLTEVEGYASGDALTRVALQTLGIGEPSAETRPYLRINFSARASTPSWASLFEFAEAAHSHIHSCLARLTTDAMRSIWYQP